MPLPLARLSCLLGSLSLVASAYPKSIVVSLLSAAEQGAPNECCEARALTSLQSSCERLQTGELRVPTKGHALLVDNPDRSAHVQRTANTTMLTRLATLVCTSAAVVAAQLAILQLRLAHYASIGPQDSYQYRLCHIYQYCQAPFGSSTWRYRSAIYGDCTYRFPFTWVAIAALAACGCALAASLRQGASPKGRIKTRAGALWGSVLVSCWLGDEAVKISRQGPYTVRCPHRRPVVVRFAFQCPVNEFICRACRCSRSAASCWQAASGCVRSIHVQLWQRWCGYRRQRPPRCCRNHSTRCAPMLWVAWYRPCTEDAPPVQACVWWVGTVQCSLRLLCQSHTGLCHSAPPVVWAPISRVCAAPSCQERGKPTPAVQPFRWQSGQHRP